MGKEKEKETTFPHSAGPPAGIPETHDETKEKSGGEHQPPSITTLVEDEVESPAAAEEWEYVTGIKLTVVMIAVCAAAFVMLLDTSIVVTAIPKITSHFHSLEDIGWYGSAYLLSSSALQPMTGKLYAQFSSKWTFMCFLGLFELGSLLCGVATSSKMLIIGRAVGGMGGSGIVNGALTIISACVPLEKRPMYLGLMFGIAQLGIMFGPLLGGALTEYASWRWCFYINLPIGGLIVLFLFFIHIPDRRVKSQLKTTIPDILNDLDLPGFGLFAPSSVMFLLALEWGGNQYKWGDATIIGLFCGAGGVFALFLGWEYHRGDTAMIPLSMLKTRIVWASVVSQFFLAAAMLTLSYYMAIYFQAIKGVQPTLSGVYILPSILSQLALSVISGALVSRLGYYLPWITGGTALATVGAGLLSSMKPDTAVVRWVFYQIIGGIGRGASMQMPIVAVQNTVKPELNSVAMSALVFSQSFGSALFLAFAQTIFSNGLREALPHFAPEVDAQTVINAGATAVRNVVPAASLKGVILAYNQAVSHVFYLAVGAAFGAFLFSWGMGWKSIKKAKAASPETEA